MAELTKNRDRHAFSGWPMIVAWAAMMVFAFHSSTHMVAAGDTWVAMACGRHFINHGVDTVEPFSANSHKAGPTPKEVSQWPGWAKWITAKVGIENVKKIHPTGWVNQNWLTHVIFYWLTHLSPVADAENYSFNTLVYWKISLYILSVICVYYTGRLLGANPVLAAVFACFAMFTARSFLDVRPAGFSNLLVAVFLLILVLATYRNILYLWLTVPLTVFWCNVHGGYIYVFIMLAVFFILHLLATLPIRWTTAFYSIGLWMAAYLMSVKFLGYQPNESIPPLFEAIDAARDKLFYLILIFGATGIALAIIPRLKPEAFYGFFSVSTFIVIFWSFTRFMIKPRIPSNLSNFFVKTINQHITEAQWTFLAMVTVLICLGLALMLLKDRLIRHSPKQLVHVGAVGMVTFFACLIFNPFHLTNFTHTFIISVSKHAEMWRAVHEWHPAFAWDNPVGTGFPYMVLVILVIGLVPFWLLSRLMVPKSLSQRHNINKERKNFSLLSIIFGCALAIFVCYVAFVSLSLTPAISGLVLVSLFVGIILLSILVNVNLIFALVPIILMLLMGYELSNSKTTYSGTYIYPFLIIPTFVGIYAVTSLVSKQANYKPIHIVYVFGAAAAIIVLMTLFMNPLKLKTVSESGSPGGFFEQFLNIKRPWRPPYEANLDSLTRSYNQNLFRDLYIINILSIAYWFFIPAVRKLSLRNNTVNKEPQERNDYELPKVDIAYLIVALLTIYMAYRSRRFIPIAAFAACPVLAMIITRITKNICASFSFYRNGKFVVCPMPQMCRWFFSGAGVLILVVFTLWCGLKFKEIYLNPWPLDPKLTSVFMRMTASHAKPFYALKFIDENHLSGKMFNYWTEGGFIAYGQHPDPNTGKTPLQLYMDGRAQAAYTPAAFKRWQELMAGTSTGDQIARAAQERKRMLTEKEYLAIGKLLAEELRKDNVWVVLMPLNVRGADRILTSLEVHPDWALVFYNDKQKILVDIRSPQGAALFSGMGDGKTKYPDEFSKRLSIAHSLLSSGPAHKDLQKAGLENAIVAMELNPSQGAMIEVFSGSQSFGPAVFSFCKQYVEDFIKNKPQYEKEDGYLKRIATAIQASSFLAKSTSNRQERADFVERIEKWSQEAKDISRDYMW
jgi:hypothetical protein